MMPHVSSCIQVVISTHTQRIQEDECVSVPGLGAVHCALLIKTVMVTMLLPYRRSVTRLLLNIKTDRRLERERAARRAYMSTKKAATVQE